MKTTQWNDFVVKELKYDNDLLDLYIKEALDDFQKTREINEFLYKLRHIIIAKGGMDVIAKKSKLSRTGLYKMFNTNHFRVDNFVNVLDAVGLKLSIQPSRKYKYI